VREDLAAVREDLAAVREDLAALVPVRKGHFSLESGHHGDTWLELARLCLHPGRVRRLAEQLGDRLVELRVEAVCGPLVEGAFVAFLVASHLGVPFVYADRQETGSGIRYRVPAALREALCGRRVAIVDDAISAGSAVGATFADLGACGAEVVAIGALATLGPWALRFASDRSLGLEALVSLQGGIWTAADCPLCARGEPITTAAAARC